MKFNMKLVQAGLIAAMATASAGASAAVFPDFTFDPAGATAPFTADKMTGNYSEIVTFDGLGGFTTSIKWEAGQFVANDGGTALSAGVTRLGVDYSMYAFFEGTGTVAPSGTNFNFTFLTGTLNLWLDPQNDATGTFVAPGTGAGSWTVGGAADTQIGVGSLLSGSGNLIGLCSGINCGSFGTITSFALVGPGSTYFTAPVPFYDLSFESGQLNSFVVTGTQEINGSLDVVFGRVPEPSSIALLGLGLLGMSVGLRRRKQA